ncbi:MAG: hypothetical protein J5497_03405 [Selenomonadaceae bacterium]|nr:hypothetical protein [Selenomonadaceae bacterium]
MIRDLARKLTAFVEFFDCVIIELTFRRGTFEAGAQVVKAHSSMILLRASSIDAELLVKLISPRREIRAALGCRIQSSEKIWRVFTASEIFDFVAAVGDKNRIHQLNPPIVPGLLILETLLTCAEFSASDSIKLKFKNFITAGEPLILCGGGNRFEICSAGVRKVLITVG